jgi:hypothetical protein
LRIYALTLVNRCNKPARRSVISMEGNKFGEKAHDKFSAQGFELRGHAGDVGGFRGRRGECAGKQFGRCRLAEGAP